MALQYSECWKSREGVVGRESADTYQVVVWGSPDPNVDNADDPGTVWNYIGQHISPISELGNALNNISREWLAPGVWRFTINFRSPTGDRATNDAVFSFTTGGGTQHITHAKQHVASYPPPTKEDGSDAPPDFQGAINVSDSGVEGIDVHIATYDFKTTFYVAPGDMTQQYIAQLYRLTGSVNSDSVTMQVDGVTLTFQSGELLFLGADGSKRKDFTDWELTLNWSASPNAQNLAVGNITGITKNGWDYLWVKYKPGVDSSTLVQQPEAVYIEQVYTYQALQPLVRSTTFGAGNSQFWTAPKTFNGAGLITSGGQ